MKTGILLLSLLCLFVLFPVERSLAAPASASVPLDSWIYPALDKLAGLGLIESALQGSRPFSRHEAARLTLEASENAGDSLLSPVVEEILLQLKRELQSPLAELKGTTPKSYFLPVREFRFYYIYQESTASTPAPTTKTFQHALNTNNFGIEYQEKNNAEALLETEARLGSSALLNWRFALQIDEESDPSLRTLLGTATFSLGPIQISAGRESLWWGQGRHGSLLLTNNAKPLDMIRITNPTPARLPWLLSYLGPFRFDVFWSRLESERAIPEPYFAGLRVNVKPQPWLEIGAARMVIFGGKGRAKVDLSEFLTILGGKNLNGNEDTSNQLAAIDTRIKLPMFGGAELYGELGGEDEAGLWFYKNALLTGLYLPSLEPSGRLALRLEYADLDFQKSKQVWYQHSLYKSGYTYQKKILGHHIGGDAHDYYAAIELFLPHKTLLTGGVDIERRGMSTATIEKHFQPFVSLEPEFTPGWKGSLHLAWDEVENAGFVSGSKRNDILSIIGVRGTW